MNPSDFNLPTAAMRLHIEGANVDELNTLSERILRTLAGFAQDAGPVCIGPGRWRMTLVEVDEAALGEADDTPRADHVWQMLDPFEGEGAWPCDQVRATPGTDSGQVGGAASMWESRIVIEGTWLWRVLEVEDSVRRRVQGLYESAPPRLIRTRRWRVVLKPHGQPGVGSAQAAA